MAELHLLFWSKAWLENAYLENLFVNTASDDPPASHTPSACVLRSTASLQPVSVQHQFLSLGSENCWHVLAWMDIKVNLVLDVASRSRTQSGFHWVFYFLFDSLEPCYDLLHTSVIFIFQERLPQLLYEIR